MNFKRVVPNSWQVFMEPMVKKQPLDDNDAVQKILGQLDRNGDFNVVKVVKKERKRYPGAAIYNLYHATGCQPEVEFPDA